MKKFKYASQELENLIVGASKLEYLLDHVMIIPMIEQYKQNSKPEDSAALRERLKLHQEDYFNLYGEAFRLKFKGSLLNIKAFENQEVIESELSELQNTLKDLKTKTVNFIKTNFSDLIKNSYNKQDIKDQKNYGIYPEKMPVNETGPSFD